ncbi:MAG TPA: hypothetical protein VEQ59_18230 [Polyangiaceae bacterium]|nr:hypothetical protein [Polyangiaceae bacterium]
MSKFGSHSPGLGVLWSALALACRPQAPQPARPVAVAPSSAPQVAVTLFGDQRRLHFDGMVQDAQLGFSIALALADAEQGPSWNAADEFEAVRKASLRRAQ